MIDNAVFGKLEYDYTWYRNCKINFFNKEAEIVILISGDDEEFEEGQYDAYKALMNDWDNIQLTFLEAILEYYKNRREELGYDIEANENYPQIDTTRQLLDYITLVGIKIPYADIYGGRSVGISFDCRWDMENGLGLRLNNEQVIKVGSQDVAI